MNLMNKVQLTYDEFENKLKYLCETYGLIYYPERYDRTIEVLIPCNMHNSAADLHILRISFYNKTTESIWSRRTIFSVIEPKIEYSSRIRVRRINNHFKTERIYDYFITTDIMHRKSLLTNLEYVNNDTEYDSEKCLIAIEELFKKYKYLVDNVEKERIRLKIANIAKDEFDEE